MFRQLFKPKWQRQQPEQRLQALEQLSPDNAKHADIIALLCNDPDKNVREAAIKRCADLQILQNLNAEQPHQATIIRDRLQELLTGSQLQQSDALAAIKVEKDPLLLAQVIVQQDDKKIRELAFKRLGFLNSEEALLHVATQCREADTRFHAAQLLSSPNSWRLIQRQSQDKRINQWAREKWREHQAQQELLNNQKQVREAILTELDLHQRRSIDNLYEARLKQWQQQWQENTAAVTPEETTRFEALQNSCEQRVRDAEAAAAREAEIAATIKAQHNTINEYQATLARCTTPGWEFELGHINAALDIQERYWADLALKNTPSVALQQAFLQQQEARKEINAFIARYQDVKEKAELSDHEAQHDNIKTLLSEWPQHMALPELLKNILPTEKVEAKEETKTTAKQPAHDPLFHRLRRAVNQRNLRQANRLWLRLQNELEEQPNEARATRYEPLKEQLNELRDWHNFAAEPKKAELCEQMEALIQTEMDPEEKANAIQALHQEWRALMSSHQEADQALWDRFKAASDAAYEPCKAHFAKLDEQRQRHLEKRQALCAQLEALLDKVATDETTDWHALFEIRRQAPKAYRQFEPVRFTDSKATDARFSQLLRSLDKALTAITAQHVPLHEALIEKLEAELDQPHHAEQLDALKQAQSEWRELPWIHPREYRRLNRAFRHVADAVFQKNQQQRQAARAQHAENKQQLIEALTTFRDRLATLSAQALTEEIAALRSLPCPPREKELAKERQKIIQQAEQHLQRLPWLKHFEKLEQQINAVNTLNEVTEEARTLVIAAEVIAAVDSPEADKSKRMQWQLEQLPSMMTKGRSTALEQFSSLLEEHEKVLTEGLVNEHKQRLLHAISQLKLSHN